MDTNAILYYLSDKEIAFVKVEFVMSFITEIELLSYPGLKNEEEKIIRALLKTVDIVDVNSKIKEYTINFRKTYKLKIPDAMICATAYFFGIPLVTNDRQIFKVKECVITTYEMFRNTYAVLKRE